MRNVSLKSREGREPIPAEKLLDILMGIYPEKLALEVFDKLTSEDNDEQSEDQYE